MRRKTVAGFAHALALDSHRNLDVDPITLDVIVVFTGPVGDAGLVSGQEANGHALYGNTPLYISGSGTATWVLRTSGDVHADQAILYSYERTMGNTLSGGTEIAAVVATASNHLVNQIRFHLYGENGLPAVNTTIKLGVFQYNGGNPTVFDKSGAIVWMVPITVIVTSTDGDGLINLNAAGVGSYGDQVYVAVFQPSDVPVESFLGVDVIQ